MKLQGDTDFAHDSNSTIGVLLVNLGTPEEPTAKKVKPYLRQFLSDKRVIEAPQIIWWFILNFFILPFRSVRSAAAYKKIWTDEGSPLLVNAKEQTHCIGKKLPHCKVVLGMSYSTPSIASALQELKKQHCRHLIVLPLYPQYSSTTTGSVYCDVSKELSTWRYIPHFRFIADYCSDQRYISALANSIQSNSNNDRDLLIFSFHGTPTNMLLAGDPYHCLCHKTARLTATKLGLTDTQWKVTFQSRFGRTPWLQPYTDKTLEKLATDGIKKVDVVCPAFSADCLETLEEIAQENRDIFIKAGGETYRYIPALNSDAAHIDFLSNLIQDATQDWQASIGINNKERDLQQQQYSNLATLPFYSSNYKNHD